MSVFTQCSFFRDSGIRYCDLDGKETTCNGDLNSCEDLKFSEASCTLVQHLQERLDEREMAENKGD